MATFVPTFASPHLAAEFIEAYQAARHIKKCAHVQRGALIASGISPGYPVLCGKQSFDIHVVQARAHDDPGIGFFGCPKNCRLYRPRWKERLARWEAGLHPLLWFERQPWQVKVAVILAPVLLVAVFRGALADLVALARTIVEAWRGK